MKIEITMITGEKYTDEVPGKDIKDFLYGIKDKITFITNDSTALRIKHIVSVKEL